MRRQFEYEMLLRVLLKRYDEFDLAKAFHAAMKISKLKSTAKHLQDHLRWHWDATTPSYEEMFVKLGLDPTKDGFLGSPLFRTWYQHVEIFGYRRDSAVVKILKDRLGNFGLAKMLHAAEKVEETKVIASNLQKARFADWALKCEKELGLTSLKPLNPDLKSDDLFRNPPSDAWDKIVDADDLVYIEHEMLLRMLLDLYNEFDLAKAFHAAMKIDELQNTAECLQLHLDWHWGVTKPPYEQLFVDLDLDPTKDDFVGSPLFRTWYRRVQGYGFRRDSAVVDFLKARIGDFGVAKMLEAARKGDSAKYIVDDLEKAFIHEWHKYHPDRLFDRLGLKATSDNLLSIPLFKMWYKFATQKWSTEKVVSFLLSRSDDFSFAKMLEAVKKVDSTSVLAIELEKAYIRVWRFENPDELFDRLGLEAKNDDLLGIPLFKMWHKFAKEEWSTLEVALFLKARIGDASFAKMLDAAKKDYSTNAIAMELEKAYTPQWRYDDPELVFDNLGLDAKSNDLLVNPLFKIWCKYVDWNRSHSKAVEMLKDRLGDFGVAKMLEAGKKVDAIAVKLEDAYIASWPFKIPESAFDELGLKATSDDLLGNPLFKTWYKFATQKWSTEEVMTFLKARMGDFGLAEMLVAGKKVDAIFVKLDIAYIRGWKGKYPDEVFDRLGLKAKNDDLLGNPLFKMWHKFAKEKWSTLKIAVFLKARMGDFDFAEMLDAAKKGKDTKALAIELEDAFILLWRNDDPELVFTNLRLDAKSRDLLGVPLFKMWLKFATQKWSTEKVMTFLKARPDEFGLAKMLEAATTAEDTFTIATELLEALFEYWSSSRVSESTVRKEMGLGFFKAVFKTLGHHQDPVDPIGYGVWKKYREWLQKPLIKRKRQDLHARFDDSSLDKKLKATDKADG